MYLSARAVDFFARLKYVDYMGYFLSCIQQWPDSHFDELNVGTYVDE